MIDHVINNKRSTGKKCDLLCNKSNRHIICILYFYVLSQFIHYPINYNKAEGKLFLTLSSFLVLRLIPAILIPQMRFVPTSPSMPNWKTKHPFNKKKKKKNLNTKLKEDFRIITLWRHDKSSYVEGESLLGQSSLFFSP